MRAARRRDADERPQEFRIAGDDGGRQAPLAHELRGPVDVREDRFEQLGALDQPGLQLLPFGGIDQQRHVAERPGPHRPRRVLVDPIEHAGIAQMPVGGGKPPVDLLRPERREHAQERPPVLAHPAVVVHHLVEVAGENAVVARQQRFEVLVPLRSAVEMSHARHQT